MFCPLGLRTVKYMLQRGVCTVKDDAIQCPQFRVFVTHFPCCYAVLKYELYIEIRRSAIDYTVSKVRKGEHAVAFAKCIGCMLESLTIKFCTMPTCLKTESLNISHEKVT